MDEMFNPKAAGGREKRTFGNLDMVKNDAGGFQTMSRWSGHLPKVSFGLLQLLVSLTFFLLLVIVLVELSRVHKSVQNQTEELQQKCILNETSGMEKVEAAPQKQIQAAAHPDLDVLRQQLVWMNATLGRLCRPCPWDWKFFLGSCYWFSKSLNNWKSSLSACELLNAQLVVINNEAEEVVYHEGSQHPLEPFWEVGEAQQKFLQSWEVRHEKRTWIGLSDHHNEGSWRWVDNTPIELSYWKQGEPNNDGDEDCVELYNDGWNDDKCNQEKVWICEKIAVPCPAL